MSTLVSVAGCNIQHAAKACSVQLPTNDCITHHGHGEVWCCGTAWELLLRCRCCWPALQLHCQPACAALVHGCGLQQPQSTHANTNHFHICWVVPGDLINAESCSSWRLCAHYCQTHSHYNRHTCGLHPAHALSPCSSACCPAGAKARLHLVLVDR